MNSLLGDRFLKKFTGEIRHRLKHPTSKTEGQQLDVDERTVPESDGCLADEDQGKGAAGTQKTGQHSAIYQAEGEHGFFRGISRFSLSRGLDGIRSLAYRLNNSTE